MKDKAVLPIFFIGMPRSGTTIIFEAFARHPHLAWASNYSDGHPGSIWLNCLRRLHDNALIRIQAEKNPRIKIPYCNRYFVRPDEAYGFWNHYTGVDFARDYLIGLTAGKETAAKVRDAVARTVACQGRERFSAKLTGPPRITYLSSIFPDARFVHVIRDGRAVTHSLLNVPFWKEKGGFDGPFWKNGLSEEYLKIWEKDKDPGLITALEWRFVLELADRERQGIAPERYMEVKYEDFTADPHKWIEKMSAFCRLPASNRPHEYVGTGEGLKNMNYKYSKDWSPGYIAKLEAAMAPRLDMLGYA